MPVRASVSATEQVKWSISLIASIIARIINRCLKRRATISRANNDIIISHHQQKNSVNQLTHTPNLYI